MSVHVSNIYCTDILLMYHFCTSNGRLELPMHLAIYNNYKKVDAPWSIREPLTLEKVSGAKLIHFDKSHKPWHQTKAPNFENDVTSLWWKYIAPSTNTLFNS